ncbi:helix-turn-helix domain-containing protein [Rhizophagus irregularis DAOM 181602=DAOM 197198]|nr:helix-turn-helix domain-containing protein [Rhizophagus irregularis DAOM 181602=DAOM 197198]
MNNNDCRKLLKIIKKNNKLSLGEIQQKFHSSQDKQISANTIRKNLHQMQIYSRVAVPKPLLTESQREKRLSWCIERQSCHVWQKNRTRYNIENLTPTVKHGGGSIMMWGCFSGKGLGLLVKVDGKMNRLDYIDILEKNLLPFIQSKHHRQRYAFQDDNGLVHTARDVKN